MSKATKKRTTGRTPERKSRGKSRGEVSFPVAPACGDMPVGYADVLAQIKQRIGQERLRVVMSANSAMVLLYWDIGRMVLGRQEREGWGAKVIDRLSVDLRDAYPDMSGLSPRNLKYMRAFAAAWADREIVQRTVAQLPWRSNLTLLDKLSDEKTRLWYAQKALEQGMGKDMLAIQIETRLHEREGKAINNFPATLPPAESDMAAQVFKDPYLFDFIGTADPRREREVEQALVDHIQRFLSVHADSHEPALLRSFRPNPEHLVLRATAPRGSQELHEDETHAIRGICRLPCMVGQAQGERSSLEGKGWRPAEIR